MGVGDGRVSVRVWAPAAGSGLILLVRSVTGASYSEAAQVIRDGAEMFVAQLYGEDHDDTESRILELWQEAPAFSATVEVTVDGKVVGPDEFTNLCRQWRELLAQVRLDIEREQGAG